MTDDTPISERMTKLKERATQQTSMHASLRDRLNRWSRAANAASVIASTLLLAVVMAPEDLIRRTFDFGHDGYVWSAGLTAAVNFLLALLPALWRPDARAEHHDRAVSHYTRIAYRIRAWNDENECDEAIAEEIINEHIDDRDLPRISSSEFLRLKRRYRMQKALARDIDSNPFPPIWWYRFKHWRASRDAIDG